MATAKVSETTKKIRNAIKAKLEELGANFDEELPDYIIIMIANRKTRGEMAKGLRGLLGKKIADDFARWLHRVLELLQALSGGAEAVGKLRPPDDAADAPDDALLQAAQSASHHAKGNEAKEANQSGKEPDPAKTEHGQLPVEPEPEPETSKTKAGPKVKSAVPESTASDTEQSTSKEPSPPVDSKEKTLPFQRMISSALGPGKEATPPERLARINSPEGRKDLEPGEVPRPRPPSPHKRRPRERARSPKKVEPKPVKPTTPPLPRVPAKSRSPVRGTDPSTWQHPMSRTQRLIAESARIRGLQISSKDALEEEAPRSERRTEQRSRQAAISASFHRRPSPPRRPPTPPPRRPTPPRHMSPPRRRGEDLSGANTQPVEGMRAFGAPAPPSSSHRRDHHSRAAAGPPPPPRLADERGSEGGRLHKLRSTVVVTAQVSSGLKSVAIRPDTSPASDATDATDEKDKKIRKKKNKDSKKKKKSKEKKAPSPDKKKPPVEKSVERTMSSLPRRIITMDEEEDSGSSSAKEDGLRVVSMRESTDSEASEGPSKIVSNDVRGLYRGAISQVLRAAVEDCIAPSDTADILADIRAQDRAAAASLSGRLGLKIRQTEPKPPPPKPVKAAPEPAAAVTRVSEPLVVGSSSGGPKVAVNLGCLGDMAAKFEGRPLRFADEDEEDENAPAEAAAAPAPKMKMDLGSLGKITFGGNSDKSDKTEEPSREGEGDGVELSDDILGALFSGGKEDAEACEKVEELEEPSKSTKTTEKAQPEQPRFKVTFSGVEGVELSERANFGLHELELERAYLEDQLGLEFPDGKDDEEKPEATDDVDEEPATEDEPASSSSATPVPGEKEKKIMRVLPMRKAPTSPTPSTVTPALPPSKTLSLADEGDVLEKPKRHKRKRIHSPSTRHKSKKKNRKEDPVEGRPKSKHHRSRKRKAEEEDVAVAEEKPKPTTTDSAAIDELLGLGGGGDLGGPVWRGTLETVGLGLRDRIVERMKAKEVPETKPKRKTTQKVTPPTIDVSEEQPRRHSQPEQVLAAAEAVNAVLRRLPKHSEVSIDLNEESSDEEGELPSPSAAATAATAAAATTSSLSTFTGSTPCRAFPNCRFGERCRFTHPLCRFDSYCTRPGCSFSHSNRSGGVEASSQPLQMQPNIPPSGYFAGLPITCKAGRDCVRTNCPFRHPPAPNCHFGTGCTRRNCPFAHPEAAGPWDSAAAPLPFVQTGR